MKVLVYSAKSFEREIYKNAASTGIEWVFTSESLSHTSALKASGFEIVSLFSNDDASGSVLKMLHEYGVKHIALRSAGFDHVDIPTANKLGITVANIPAYSPNAIAEHAVMLMLALNRKLLPAYIQNCKQDFTLNGLMGFDMKGKTVGIVGTGRIGSVMAKILNGFECRILACDPVENETLKKTLPVTYVDFHELCSKSDIITLHCPLTTSTRYIINASSIEKMKRGVMIINTGRGGLLNTQDAWKAMEFGQIGYLGLDVYEKEHGIFFNDYSKKKDMNDEWIDRLLHHPRCILTAHQAFLTQNAVSNMAAVTVYNIEQWIHQKSSHNELTTFQKTHV